MDCIRRILLAVEAGESWEAIPGWSEIDLAAHCGLAIEGGLLDGMVFLSDEGRVSEAIVRDVTWAGHDFLDAAREERVWRRVKRTVLDAGHSWTMEGLKQVLFELARRGMEGH